MKGKSKEDNGTKDGKKAAERFEGYGNGCGKWGHRTGGAMRKPSSRQHLKEPAMVPEKALMEMRS